MALEISKGNWVCPRTQEKVSAAECRAQRRFGLFCKSCVDGELVEHYAVSVKIGGREISCSPQG